MKKISARKLGVLLLLISITTSFIIIEGILRIIEYRSDITFKKDESDFIRYHESLHYTYRPNLNITLKNENYTVQVHTNSLGYRDEEWTTNANNINILIIGDSFSVGHGIDKTKRWSHLLEKMLNKKIGYTMHFKTCNAAVSGYSLRQIYNTSEELLPLIEPRMVILGLNIDGFNRLSDPYVYFNGFSLRKSKIHFSRVDGNQLFILHTKNLLLQDIEIFFIKNSKLYNCAISKLLQLKQAFNKKRADRLLKDNVDEVKNLITDLHSKLASKKIRLIVVPVIQHDRCKEFEAHTIKTYNALLLYFRNNKIEYIDIYTSFKEEISKGGNLWIRKDAHWNETAHSIVAKLLFEYIKEDQGLQTIRKP